MNEIGQKLWTWYDSPKNEYRFSYFLLLIALPYGFLTMFHFGIALMYVCIMVLWRQFTFNQIKKQKLNGEIKE